MNRYAITTRLYSSAHFEKSKDLFKAFSPDPFEISLNFSELNQFIPIVLFLYPLKITENHEVF